jgi:hypothetical protein
MLSSDDLQRNIDASNEFISIDTRLLIFIGLDDFLRNMDVSNKLLSRDDRLF